MGWFDVAKLLWPTHCCQLNVVSFIISISSIVHWGFCYAHTYFSLFLGWQQCPIKQRNRRHLEDEYMKVVSYGPVVFAAQSHLETRNTHDQPSFLGMAPSSVWCPREGGNCDFHLSFWTPSALGCPHSFPAPWGWRGNRVSAFLSEGVQDPVLILVCPELSHPKYTLKKIISVPAHISSVSEKPI